MNALQKDLLAWYEEQGRSWLPWRSTRDPYKILVSEFMLQQTQVDRVLPKYGAFIERFPTVAALAAASTADVLREWKGLGYNSRAVRLKAIAQTVSAQFSGVMPREREALLALPGVGAYTAAALAAFAFDEDDLAPDTNVRRVTHRTLYGLEYPAKAPAPELDAAGKHLVPRGRGHDWNSALMDLGATICTARAPKCLICPVRRSCNASPVDAAQLELLRSRFASKRSPQEAIPFVQTTRFARGRIVDRLRELAPGSGMSLFDLHRDLRAVLPPESLGGMENTLKALERDGIVRREGESFALTEE
ncbi:MAG: A/G-specific adenine glycosylase [Candidatus Baltobacteraceae bacterium]